MSEEMREQINKVKNWKQFLNEDVDVNYDLYDNALNILFEYQLTLDEVSDFAETQLNLQRNGYGTFDFLNKIHDAWNTLTPYDKFNKMVNFKYSKNNLLSILNRMTTKKKDR